MAPATQTPQTLPGFSTACRVQIYRITDTQTPPVRIFTYTPILADTPDTSMYRYCLKTTYVHLACVHVHRTRHTDTPDTLNIGTVAPAMQTPQTLQGLSTACMIQISRITDTQTLPDRNCTYTSNLADTPDTSRYIYYLKSPHVHSACVHVHPTRHTDTPDTLNVGTVAPAMQTP